MRQTSAISEATLACGERVTALKRWSQNAEVAEPQWHRALEDVHPWLRKLVADLELDSQTLKHVSGGCGRAVPGNG